MTQTRWYKPSRKATKFELAAPAQSMLANDAPGGDETLLKDGWTLDKPDGYVEPTAEQTQAEKLEDANAEIRDLKKKLAAETKKGSKNSR